MECRHDISILEEVETASDADTLTELLTYDHETITESTSSTPSSSSSIVSMGPPIGIPFKKQSVERRYQSHSNHVVQHLPLSNSFPTIPKGEFTFITATQQGMRFIGDYSEGQTIGYRQNRRKSEQEISSSPSPPLQKGIQLLPINEYNKTLGNVKTKEKQIPTVEEMQRIKEWKEIGLREETNKILSIANGTKDVMQRGRHIMLRNWWEGKMQERQNEFQTDFIRHDGIRFGGTIYQQNKFFAPPSNELNRSENIKNDIKNVFVKSRLLWEATQDGLISIDTILALPIDWEETCIEHYKNIEVLPSDSEFQCQKLFPSIDNVENPLTLISKRLSHPSHKQNSNLSKIQLQYSH